MIQHLSQFSFLLIWITLESNDIASMSKVIIFLFDFSLQPSRWIMNRCSKRRTIVSVSISRTKWRFLSTDTVEVINQSLSKRKSVAERKLFGIRRREVLVEMPGKSFANNRAEWNRIYRRPTCWSCFWEPSGVFWGWRAAAEKTTGTRRSLVLTPPLMHSYAPTACWLFPQNATTENPCHPVFQAFFRSVRMHAISSGTKTKQKPTTQPEFAPLFASR